MKSLQEIKKMKTWDEQARAIDDRKRELIKRSSMQHLANVEWSSIKSQREWDKAQKTAVEDYLSGKFFMDRLGGWKENDPQIVATLLYMRSSSIIELELETVPELMLLDLALITYYQILRFHGLAGDINWFIDLEFFLQEPPIKYDNYGRPDGIKTEDRINELVDNVIPLIDRLQRMFQRNLKAIRDLKRSNIILNIGQVDQMNLGEKQVNLSNQDDKS